MQQNKDMGAMNGKTETASETDFSHYREFDDYQEADQCVLKLDRCGIVGVSIPEGKKIRVYFNKEEL